jgi:hypothetical protein
LQQVDRVPVCERDPPVGIDRKGRARERLEQSLAGRLERLGCGKPRGDLERAMEVGPNPP